MHRDTDRAIVEVRQDGEELVVRSASVPAARLLGVAHASLSGSSWGSHFATADAAHVLEGCRSVLDRRRRAWTGAAQPASRAGRRVHLTATRPPGGIGSILHVELTEAAPNTPTVGSDEREAGPDEHWFARGLLEGARNPATAQAMIATDLRGVITFFNPAAERMTDRRSEDVVGYVTPAVFHDPYELASRAAELCIEPSYDVVLDDVRTGRPREWTYLRAGGDRVTVSTTSTALRDGAGEITGYLTVAHDVTEARAVRRNAVDHVQNEFITAVNHELRTPLTSILGYTDVLLDTSAGQLTSLQASMVSRIERNGRRLLKLVENLLTLSALQKGAFQVERRRVDVGGVVRDAVARAMPDLAAADLEVTLDLGLVPSYVVGDGAQLGRVVTGLVDNAIAFTPAGGTVRIALSRVANETVLEVVDSGVGIPTCDQANLFERFVRAPEAKAREDQGLGLGLAVVGAIVSSHGGRATLSSAPDSGTVVTVRLPRAADDLQLGSLPPRPAIGARSDRAQRLAAS